MSLSTNPSPSSMTVNTQSNPLPTHSPSKLMETLFVLNSEICRSLATQTTDILNILFLSMQLSLMPQL